MADAKITALTSLAGTGVELGVDVLEIVDVSITTNKKILVSNLLGAAYTAAGDIVQASGGGVAAKLAIGTARQVPTVNAGATALAYQNPITLATEQASTSGTEIDFTSIPAGVRRITIMFVGVSTNGSSAILVQLGDAGGFETTVYSSAAGPAAIVSSTIGFLFFKSANSAFAYHGHMVLTLENAASFTWVESGIGFEATNDVQMTAGSKSLSATLTSVRITTVNGTDAFDAGAINISYE